VTAHDDGVPVLWHIKMSNYNEKARWALDYKGIPHRRVDPLPGAHMLVALALTRRTVTFPVLRMGGRSIGDSTRIVAALERRQPDPPLYPADPAERLRALELEEFFDEDLGHEVRRVVFWQLMQDPEWMRSRAPEITTPRQGRLLAAVLPAFLAILRRRYSIDAASAAQSLLKVRAAMRLIEHTLDGRDYLVGDDFTVADLTGAALLAPLLGPPGLPYRDPDAGFPAGLQELVADLLEQPAGQWVIRTYELHRPGSAEIGTGSQGPT
jgi:glutathione S-transferase